MRNEMPTPSTQATESAGGTKTLWMQTPEGKARLSAIQKKARKKNPHRDTRELSQSTVSQLVKLADEGMRIVDAAKRLKIGYSTAQRHLSKARRARGAGNKESTGRISASTHTSIIKMLKAGTPVALIVKQTGVHASSVYTRKNALQRGSQPALVIEPTEIDVTAGIPLRSYNEFRHANKVLWETCRKENREPTNPEIYWVMAWRRMNEAENE